MHGPHNGQIGWSNIWWVGDETQAIRFHLQVSRIICKPSVQPWMIWELRCVWDGAIGPLIGLPRREKQALKGARGRMRHFLTLIGQRFQPGKCSMRPD